MQFLHDHVGFISYGDTGFQFGVSWGVLFGIPITLVLLYFFNHVSRIWHRFTRKAAEA